MSIAQVSQVQKTTDSVKMLRAMVTIGVICAFLIVSTFELTLPAIERNKAAALEAAVFKVLPGIVTKRIFIVDDKGEYIPVSEMEKDAQYIFAGYDQDNQLVGLAVEASGQGFADILRILYGYNISEQAIIGFHVLQSKETPGLGDKIEKDQNFLANFESLDVSLSTDQSSLVNSIKTVKHGTKQNPWEIDGITGATISSRAIGNILASSTSAKIPAIYAQEARFVDPVMDEKKKTDE